MQALMEKHREKTRHCIAGSRTPTAGRPYPGAALEDVSGDAPVRWIRAV